MRRLAAVVVLAGLAAGTAAVGDALIPAPPARSHGDAVMRQQWETLRDAVFLDNSQVAAPIAETRPLELAGGPAAEAGLDLPFSPAPYTGTPLDRATALTDETYVPGRGVARWEVTEVAIPRDAGRAVDAIRVAVGRVVSRPGGLPPDPGSSTLVDDAAYEVTYRRGWPGAVAVETEEFDVDFTPHAGVGFSNAGGSAEAGAVVRLTRRSAEDWAERLGVRDGRRFGDQGRWYLFAAASGRAVGLNMTRDRDGGWTQAGVSQDSNSALISDLQAGVGWRKGHIQASFGYLQRKIKGLQSIFGVEGREDNVVAVTVSVKPQR